MEHLLASVLVVRVPPLVVMAVVLIVAVVLILIAVILEATMVMMMTLIISSTVLSNVLLHIRQLFHQLLRQVLEEIVLGCMRLLHHSRVKASVVRHLILIHKAWDRPLHHLVHFWLGLEEWTCSDPCLCLAQKSHAFGINLNSL